MSDALRRILALWCAMAVGGFIGWLIGVLLKWPLAGAVTGAAIASALMTTRDALRANKLIGWLRRLPQDERTTAPRDSGYWGEAAYRIEKSLRVRDQDAQAERQRLRQVLEAIDASPNGVLMLDADDRIEWCNARAADHLGLDPVRDRQQAITNLLRAPGFVAYLQSGDYEAPIEIPGPRGRVTLQLLLRPYGVGQKLLLSQDITDRERMESMRRDFVANVSHEIRTPLTVLAGFVETLASVPLSATERPRVLDLMRQQTTRIQSLVDDLLTLAQLEGSPRPSSDRWLDANALLARTVSEAEILSAGRHEFDRRLQQGIELAGIEGELSSAFANLLGNAVRYTPEGGHIAVRWGLRESDGTAVFEVCDDGIGIAREHLPRLTERFYRVDGSRSRETGGTGLGLSIVKHVVTRHGGELEMESEPGKGSTFRIVLPAARVRRAAEVAITARGAAPASSRPGP